MTNTCNQMFLRLNFAGYCDHVMLIDLEPVCAKIKNTWCRGRGREEENRWIYLLTIDSEFHGPAVPTVADRVAGHTAVSSLVLFSHRTD